MEKKIIVMDGQGGSIGKSIVTKLHSEFPELKIVAIGTNSSATAAMIKAGAYTGASGENPVIVACHDADVIIGPIGIIIPDSLLGEITPRMAAAIGESAAVKVLIPVSRCRVVISGMAPVTLSESIDSVCNELRKLGIA